MIKRKRLIIINLLMGKMARFEFFTGRINLIILQSIILVLVMQKEHIFYFSIMTQRSSILIVLRNYWDFVCVKMSVQLAQDFILRIVRFNMQVL